MIFAWIIAGAIAVPIPSDRIIYSRAREREAARAGAQAPQMFPFEAASEANAEPVATAASPIVDANDQILLDERKQAFQAFNASLAARLREPLLAILGHAQLAKTKSDDEAIIAHAESIEREARLAKDSIERFQIIEETANSTTKETETCDLEKAVLNAIAERAIEIEGSGIALMQNLTHVPRVRGRSGEIESAVVHLIDNAIEALRDRPEKQLTIQLSWLGETVRFVMKDSGIGMSRDVQSRAFEPFYKGFQSPRHMGLGLSFVQTTLNRIGADSDIQSSPGEGTLFSIDFPVEAEARQAFEAQTVPDYQRINEMVQSFRG